MRKWTVLVKIDGGNVFVNRAGLAMLQAQLVRGQVAPFQIVRQREAVAA